MNAVIQSIPEKKNRSEKLSKIHPKTLVGVSFLTKLKFIDL